jgi:hypothetical protein
LWPPAFAAPGAIARSGSAAAENLQLELHLLPAWLQNDAFPGETPGKPFHDLTRRFEKAVAAAQLEGVCFHKLRAHDGLSHFHGGSGYRVSEGNHASQDGNRHDEVCASGTDLPSMKV